MNKISTTIALLTITLIPALSAATGCARPDYINASDSTIAAESQPAILSFPQSGLQASLTFANPPTSTAENKFELKFFNPSTNATADAGPFNDPTNSVNVLLWMTAMGHGSSPVTLTRTAAGVYDISRAYFIMPGAWQIRVQLKNSAGAIVEEADFSLTIP